MAQRAITGLYSLMERIQKVIRLKHTASPVASVVFAFAATTAAVVAIDLWQDLTPRIGADSTVQGPRLHQLELLYILPVERAPLCLRACVAAGRCAACWASIGCRSANKLPGVSEAKGRAPCTVTHAASRIGEIATALAGIRRTADRSGLAQTPRQWDGRGRGGAALGTHSS
jgi:hypothetical protein